MHATQYNERMETTLSPLTIALVAATFAGCAATLVLGFRAIIQIGRELPTIADRFAFVALCVTVASLALVLAS